MRTHGTMTPADAVALFRREKQRAEAKHSRKDLAWFEAHKQDFIDRVMNHVAPFPRTPAGKKPAAP